MKYWVISPYDSRDRHLFDTIWHYDLANGTIAIGWKPLGNIFENNITKVQYEKKYEEAFLGKRKSTYDRNSFWKFYHDIQKDDLIIARKGLRKIIGLGAVTSERPYYDEGKGRIRHGGGENYFANFIDVSWEEKNIELNKNIFLRNTIQELSEDQYLSLIAKSNNSLIEIPKQVRISLNLILGAKSQIILYGPPGTGKTYKTKSIAVEILSKKEKNASLS